MTTEQTLEPAEVLTNSMIELLYAIRDMRWSDVTALASAISDLPLNQKQANFASVFEMNANILRIAQSRAKLKKSPKSKAHWPRIQNAIVALFNASQFNFVVHLCQSLIEDFPNELILFDILGGAYLSDRNFAQAAVVYETATVLNPKAAHLFNNLGIAYQNIGADHLAIAAYETAIALRPNYAEAEHNLSLTLARHNVSKAIHHAKRAISARKNYTEALINFANLMRRTGQKAAALECTESALSQTPTDHRLLNNKALILSETGRMDEAIALFNDYLGHNPDHPETLNNLGNALRASGAKDQAIDSYKRATDIDPNFAEAHYHLSQLLKYTDGHPHIHQLTRALRDNESSLSHQKFLNYALGKVCFDLGQYDRSFDHYTTANAARKQELGYNIQQDQMLFRDIKKAFLEPYIVPKTSLGTTPIFIVGLPRSGTTLMEQIIAMSSEVTVGGELEFLPLALSETGQLVHTDDGCETFATHI